MNIIVFGREINMECWRGCERNQIRASANFLRPAKRSQVGINPVEIVVQELVDVGVDVE